MPDMNLKASEIDDPEVLLARVLYRTERLITRTEAKDDPIAFIRLMCGFNRTDLRRLSQLLGDK